VFHVCMYVCACMYVFEHVVEPVAVTVTVSVAVAESVCNTKASQQTRTPARTRENTPVAVTVTVAVTDGVGVGVTLGVGVGVADGDGHTGSGVGIGVGEARAAYTHTHTHTHAYMHEQHLKQRQCVPLVVTARIRLRVESVRSIVSGAPETEAGRRANPPITPNCAYPHIPSREPDDACAPVNLIDRTAQYTNERVQCTIPRRETATHSQFATSTTTTPPPVATASPTTINAPP
jgi:hypothetical protein